MRQSSLSPSFFLPNFPSLRPARLTTVRRLRLHSLSVNRPRPSPDARPPFLLISAMSLKAELETWAAALQAYDQEDFVKSLELFSQIADSPKILTNISIVYATLGEHEAAVEHFTAATELDQYLAVA